MISTIFESLFTRTKKVPPNSDNNIRHRLSERSNIRKIVNKIISTHENAEEASKRWVTYINCNPSSFKMFSIALNALEVTCRYLFFI